MNEPSKKKYDEEIYTRINTGNLILFGIYLVSLRGDNCTFERLVAECFLQFPRVFAFRRYPEWPDSLKFDRPLRKLREMGLVVGTIKDRFLLTEFGKQKALETKEILEKANMVNRKGRKVFVGRSADDRLVEYLKSSQSFKDYLNNLDNFSISEAEFRNLLRCTLETPLRVLKQNLKYYKEIAHSYNEKQLLDFLLFCEKQFLKRR